MLSLEIGSLQTQVQYRDDFISVSHIRIMYDNVHTIFGTSCTHVASLDSNHIYITFTPQIKEECQCTYVSDNAYLSVLMSC